jgi:hypothetical protein
MIQEQQPQRSEKSDLRVHACLYFIRPTGHTYVSFISLWSFTDLVVVSSPSTLRS